MQSIVIVYHINRTPLVLFNTILTFGYRIWKGFENESFRLSDSMIAYLSLEEKVVAIDAIQLENKLKILLGLVNGEVLLWTLSITDITNLSDIETVDTKLLFTHEGEITDVSFNQTGTKVATCSLDRYLYVCDIATEMILFKKELLNGLICLDWRDEDEFLYLGDKEGIIHIWHMTTGDEVTSVKAFLGPVTSLISKKMETHKCFIAAGVDLSEYIVKAWSTI